MRFKKVVATVIMAALITTSSAFTETVYAADLMGSDSSVTEESVAPVQQENAEAKGTENDLSQSVDTAVETAISGTEESHQDETRDDREIKQAPDDSQQEGSDVSDQPADAVEPTDTVKTEDTELEGGSFEMSAESYLKSTDYFNVKANGELEVKAGAKLEEDVIIPADCVKIPDEFFKGNRIVKTIRFDKYYMDGTTKKNVQELTTIGKNAFENSAIEEIIGLPAGVMAIPDDCFIGSNIKSITYETNQNTENSTVQSYSQKITTIGKNAFKGTNLEKTVFDFGELTTIDTSAFEDSNVTEVIAGKVVSIGNSAFRNCSKLVAFGQRSGDWPSTIKSIGSSAFEGTALTYVNMGSVILAQGAGATPDPSLYTSTFKNCKKLTSFTFPASSTKVPDNLFYGCTNLSYVSFPEPTKTPVFYGVESIEYNAFYGCTSLKDISLYNTHEVGELAFGGCSNLKTVLFGYDPNVNTFVPARIADSAFYNNIRKVSGYVMKGYDDDVIRAYATKHNYAYETLNDQYAVTKSTQALFKDTKVVISPAKVLPGEKVTITITPKGGYSLTNLVLRGKRTNKQYKNYEIETFNNREQRFSFEMPLVGAEDIDVEPITTLNREIAVSNLDYDLVDDNNARPEKDANGDYVRDIKCGTKYQIQLRNTSPSPVELPTWLWSFSSNKPNTVAVSTNGIVSILGPGEATITCRMLNGRTTKSFKIFVGNRQRIGKVQVSNIIIPNGKKITHDTKTVGTNVYHRLRIAKSLASIEDIKVKVNMDAFAFNSNPPPVLEATSSVTKSSWNTTDVTIAAVQAASSTDNTNTIIIKKGAEGEASIGISVLNEGEKKVNERDDEDNETFVIVEVWDDTPRIAEKDITINAQKKYNAVTLFNSYADKDAPGGELGMAAGKVYEDGMFRVFYDRECTRKCTDFTVVYDKYTQRMNFVTTTEYDDRTSVGKTNTYKGLWLDVTLHDRGKYIIPLPVIKIINTPLAPRLTTSGKLNLFYNATASLAEQGTVSSIQNLSNETLNSVNLVSTQNYKDFGRRALDRRVTDRFKDNFVITHALGDSRWTVTRSNINDPEAPNYIYTENGKAIVSGYVYLEYEGYKYPVMLPYTVPTEVTAPKYVLDYTSGTAHTEVRGQHFTVHLLYSGTRNVVSLANLDAGTDGLVIDESLSKNDSVDRTVLGDDIATNGIRIGIPQAPARGAVSLRIHMTTWSDYDGRTTSPKYLRYNFTVNTTSTLPNISLNQTRPTFNLAYTNELQKITAKSTMPDFIPLVAFKDLTFVGNATQLANNPFVKDLIVKTPSQGGATRITVNNSATPVYTDDGSLSIELPVDPTTQKVTFVKGTYNYKITPIIRLGGAGAQEKPLNPITFSVAITDNKPVLRLTNATFTVNYNATIVKKNNGTADTYEETAFSETPFSLTNLMTGTVASDYTVDLSGATYTAAANVPAAYKIAGQPYGGIADTRITQPNSGSLFRVYRVDPATAPPASFSYTYTVSGAKISRGTSVATLQPFNVIIRGIATAPAITVRGAGSANFVDALSGITYTFAVSNVPAIVTAVRVEDHTGGGTVVSNKFNIAKLAGTNNQCRLTIKSSPWAEPAKLKPNTTYKERIFFKLDATGNNKEYYVDMDVRPVQSLPTLTASSSRQYIYAGEDEDADDRADLNRNLTCYINVPVAYRNNYHVVSKAQAGMGAGYPAYKTNSDGTYTSNPPEEIFNGVRWTVNTPDSYKRAFDISDVECIKDANGNPTGVYKFNLKLKNAAAIKQNQLMTLGFLVYFNGQAVNTNGAPISIKVTVRK